MESVDVWNIVAQIAVILVALFGGGNAVVVVVRKLKEVLGTQGVWTQVLAAVVSGILGFAGLVAEGRLTPDNIGVENFSVWFLLILGASQMIYQRLRDEGVIDSASANATKLRQPR